jgi:4-hydroxybenzoate polyprenyltransferase|tara:strand:- start:2 stop:901 length:900 start_codon:yes stop_codon:yes gene_type:complete
VTPRLKQLKTAINNRFPQLKQFVSLTRFDRPIGIYLLLWPTLTALWIAAEGWPGWHLLLVFALGTVLTRSAGCIINDLADMKFDGSVKRTQDRPLIVGKVAPLEALLLAGSIAFFALLLVLTTNIYTVYMSVFAVIIAVIYPFMKRYTYLPQAFLGIAFSWGIPMTFTAVSNEIANVAWLLLIANLLWVVAYDTQYAMVDRDDDIKLGLKSTAILFAELDRSMIAILQVSFVATLLLVTRSVELSVYYYLGLSGAIGLFIYQHYLTWNRSREGCFKAFLNNHWVGFSVFLGIVAHYSLN